MVINDSPVFFWLMRNALRSDASSIALMKSARVESEFETGTTRADFIKAIEEAS